MKKAAVVYWSGTGNTEEMAREVAKGIALGGAHSVVLDIFEFKPAMLREFDSIAFGCPPFGDEELETEEFEPVFSKLEKELNGKRIALFGSYGWGNGLWMKNWEKRCKAFGAVIACPSVICRERADGETLRRLIQMGKVLAKND